MISIEARGKFAVFQSGKLVKITLGERERERELCSTSIRVGRERFFFSFLFFVFPQIFTQISFEERGKRSKMETNALITLRGLGNDGRKERRICEELFD